jgi:formylglycine-generating enzyme required for sulfatase activity
METPHHSLPHGTLIGDRFEVQSVLGIGGFGITYKGWDRHLACEVAIKEYLPLEFAARGQGDLSVRAHGTRSDDYRYGLQRFLDEARTIARFKHPNVVRVVNFLESNGTAYLVMDYEEGESLGQYLKRTGAPLTEQQVRGIAEPILRGLAVVHAGGFLHRDIKPGNIYLRREGEPLLIDFGAARQALGEHSRSVTGIVSAGYAPPEQYSTDAKKQGPWTDLYGLGATLYRCISGEDPVDSPTRREALHDGDSDPLVPAHEVGKGRYAPDLLATIDRLLLLTARERPQSAEEALAILGAETGAHSAPPSPAVRTTADTQPLRTAAPQAPYTAKPPMAPRRAWPRWVAGMAALAAVVVLALGASLGWFGRDEAAYESAVRLEGEVKALAAKLPERAQAAERERGELARRKREVEDRLQVAGGNNEALREEQTRATTALEQAETGWGLRERLVHESPRRTELQGLLTLGSRQVQDEMFEAGRETLEKANRGYVELITLDEAAETLGPAKAAAQAGQRAYLARTAGYGIADGAQVTAASAALAQGEQHISADRVVEAKEAFDRSQQAWDSALAAVAPEIARIDGEREAAGERATADAQARAEQATADAQVRAEQAAAAAAAQREQELAAERAARRRETMSLIGEMINIPAGTFRMGSGEDSHAQPVHTVSIAKPFALGKHEVTFEAYDAFATATGRSEPSDSGWGRGKRPVINVSWDDATAYAAWISQQTGERYRLPSDAEWEYAARAGSTTKYPWGDAVGTNRANCDGCGSQWDNQQTAPVGSFAANAFGLHDMHGNVFEWVQDCYHSNYEGAPAAGSAREQCDSSDRVLRGGSWSYNPAWTRSAYRSWFTASFTGNNYGFRLAQDLE